MKRIEAKKIIDDCYNKFVDDWLAANMNNLSEFEPLSSRILKALEDAGMLPPRRVPEFTKYGEPNDIGEHTWEDNDEEK